MFLYISERTESDHNMNVSQKLLHVRLKFAHNKFVWP